MRIAILRRDTALDRPDGINTAVMALSAGLVEQGHDVHYISSHVRSSIEVAKRQYDIPRLPALHVLDQGSDLSRLQATRLWISHGRLLLRKLKPDIAISNGLLPLPLGVPECNITHDLEVVGRGALMAREVFRFAKLRQVALPAATCSEIASRLEQRIRRHVTVLPNAVLPMPESVDIPFRPKLVVHIGTTMYKNPRTSVLAFAESAPPSATMFIVGPETELIQSILQQVPAECRERIRVTGFIDRADLLGLLTSARIVCVPSRYEVPVASPTVLEAAAAGAAVVASCISEDVFVAGRTGIGLSDPEDVTECATAFESLFDDDALATELALEGRHAVEKFDYRSVAMQVESVLQSLVA